MSNDITAGTGSEPDKDRRDEADSAPGEGPAPGDGPSRTAAGSPVSGPAAGPAAEGRVQPQDSVTAPPAGPGWLLPLAALLLSVTSIGLTLFVTLGPPAQQSALRRTVLESDNAALRQELRHLRTLVESGTAATDPEALRKELAAVQQQVTEQVAGLTATLTAAQTAAQSGTSSQELSGRVRGIEDAIATLKVQQIGAGDIAALTARVEALTTAQQRLESGAAGTIAGTGLVVAAGQLRDAVLSGRPFGRELAAVRALAGDDPAITTAVGELVRASDQPIDTEAELQRRFAQLIPGLIAADRNRADAGLGDRIMAQVAGLVTVRRSGGSVEGTDIDAVIARAEAALARSDLAAAIAELEALNEAPAELAAAWLTAARVRLSVDTAVLRITDAALVRLAGGH
jgi:hypothetical protein